MDIMEQDRNYLGGIYRRQDVVLVEGHGAVCKDIDGREYIDFGAGIGVNSLGYCDTEWCDAVCTQVQKLQHTSNLYYTEPAVLLAKKLAEASGYAKALFCNSGAEANECAIKLARKYSFDKYGEKSGRNRIVCLKNSFHGRTVTTLSATGQEMFHNYFFPFTEGFDFVPANDIPALEQAISPEKTCAVLVEFIQGEGGVQPLNPDYAKQVYSLCAKNDILLIADEVQTGAGRTGRLLASQNYGVQPDITTLAKGLGGGLPIGAVLMNRKTSNVFGYGDHGTTFGGNPVVCAGALVVLERIAEEGFLFEVRKKGDFLKSAIEKLNGVEGVDGMGLMLGIRLKEKKAPDVVKECLKNGLLILTAKEKIRLLPPLTISEENLERGISILKKVLL